MSQLKIIVWQLKEILYSIFKKEDLTFDYSCYSCFNLTTQNIQGV